MTTAVVIKNTAQKGVIKAKVQDVIFGIVAQKSATGMTNQQIADAANVSKTTVDRMLRNDPCTSPAAQTLFDVANAVGCRFGDGKPGDEHAECREQIELMKAHHVEMVAHYNRALAVKTRWLRFAVILSLVLFALIIAVLLLDVIRPGVGWFRS